MRVAHLDGVLSDAQRAELLAEARALAWSTARHASVPTTDVPVARLPWLDEHMALQLHERILPAVAALFEVDVTHLWMRDLFLVKYAMDGQRSLRAHTDASPYSFVVLVSDPTDFEGGGTHFLGTGQTMTLQAGQALIFSGREWHSAAPVTSGTRYVITGFVQRSATGAGLRRPNLLFNRRARLARQLPDARS